MLIFINPASGSSYYNTINFNYHRKNKLLEQLSVLGDKLKDFTLYGISPSNQQKKTEQEQKNLNEKTKRANTYIERFNKNNYWEKSDASTFYDAKKIAEAYEEKDALNNKAEAIRYYRKAASIPLDSLIAAFKGNKTMITYQQKQLGQVYFQLAYLLDDEGNNGQEAIMWYQKAAEVSYSKSSSNLNIARLYKGGLQGVEKDWNQAKKYYEIAADENSAQAMYLLGKMYKEGGINLEKDESKSNKWFKKACKEDKSIVTECINISS